MNFFARQTNSSDVAVPSSSTPISSTPASKSASAVSDSVQPSSPPPDNSTSGQSSSPSDPPPSSQPSSSPSSPPPPPPTTSDPPPPPPSSSSSPHPPTSTSFSVVTSVVSAPISTSAPVFSSVFVTVNASTASELDQVSSLSNGALTTVTTDIDGHITTFVTAAPTSLDPDSPGLSNLDRTALIAGTTTGGVLLLCVCLAILFLYKRSKNRRLGFIEALVRGRREGKGAGGLGLLDGEFEDDDNLPMTRYRDNVSGTPTSSVYSQGPLFRPRASQTGSAFHEGVWPPPGEESRFVDPIKRGSEIDLSSIVDQVMGPAPITADAAAGASTAVAADAAHPRDASAGSAASSRRGLIAGAAPPAVHGTHMSTDSVGSLYTDPFRTASHSTTPSSVYYYDPVNAAESRHQPQASGSSTLSAVSAPEPVDIPRTTATPPPLYTPTLAPPPNGTVNPYPMSLLGLPAGAAQPKKPSPLAGSVVQAASSLPSSTSRSSTSKDTESITTMTSRSQSATPTNWLERSPKKIGKGLS